jgi:hypothetical protein
MRQEVGILKIQNNRCSWKSVENLKSIITHPVTFQSGVHQHSNISIVFMVSAITSVLMAECDEEDREQGSRHK